MTLSFDPEFTTAALASREPRVVYSGEVDGEFVIGYLSVGDWMDRGYPKTIEV